MKYGQGSDKKKKLSWIYRRKVKSEKSKTSSEAESSNVERQNKKARIIVRNLSFKVTEEQVREFYQTFGQIEEVNLLRHPDGKLVGCGFVQFKNLEDASKAIFSTNKKEFYGRVINSSWAIAKSKFCEKLERVSTADAENSADKEESEHSVIKDKKNKETTERRKCTAWKQQQRKLQKEKKQKKRARIIIRNLSFKATEEHLKEHFSEYGEIEEIKILTKEDGKLLGCAFIQFVLVQSAAKAIHYANLQPLLDRKIVVDWAVSKTKFNKNTLQIKNEKETANESDVKTAAGKRIGESDTSDAKLEKKENIEERVKDDSELSDDNVKEDLESLCDEGKSNLDTSIKEEDEEDDEDEENEEDDKTNIENYTRVAAKARFQSHDVTEGRTVFLKNVPFSVKNDELKACMEQFGPVLYALVCIDPLTEHSKGTAFVKFKIVEDAEKCLAAGTELRLRDQILDVHRAMHRSEVENKASLQKQKERDSRNLYLVKEGVILANTPAAAEVSPGDMAKRLQLEQWKSQILRNLNMFVSRVRLVVHNLPANLDDGKLKEIFKSHSGPKAIITEARVMRDLKNVEASGIGKSKGHAFVTFTTHEDALKALRSINNNPNVFNKNKRPIVAFSIENRIMVNAKQKRAEKSRERNPLWREKRGKRKHESMEEKGTSKKSRVDKPIETETSEYTGLVGRPGECKLRSKFNLKSQAILHKQALKKEKKQNKTAKKLTVKKAAEEKAKNKIKPKEKTKSTLEDENFNKLVNSYRDKLNSIGIGKTKCITMRLLERTLKKLLINNPSIRFNAVRTLDTLATEIEGQTWSHCRPYSQIPGPKPIPILGNTWRFLPYIGDFKIQNVDQVSKRLHGQYGDIVKIEGLLGRPDMVFVYDANEIERIFRREERMPHRPSMPSLDYYKHTLRRDLFQDTAGVIAVHGEMWYNFRSKVQQVMLQPRTARMYVGAIEEASLAFLQRIARIRDENYEVPDDFLNEVHKWSLESIAQVALDVRLGCFREDAAEETQQLIDAINVFFKKVGVLELKIPFWKLFNTPTWQEYVKALDVIVNITSMYTNAALSKSKKSGNVGNPRSLLERVLALEGNAKIAATLALDLFLVGVDTTSNAVASTLYQLALHPEKQALAYEEVKSVLPGKNMKMESTHIDKLKYLRACIKETLRMYPVVIGNGRSMTKDTIISGYRVPKGVHVVFQHYVISNLEKYFPRSGDFLPERWMNNEGVRHNFASLPFGYGRRMCLGRRFAELEMMIVVGKILQTYKVEFHRDKLKYYINPMYTPEGPLNLRFVDR
ncbi:hypothetical protein KM043_004876 [Ampulex compressa]|nr:hypothetical protein KM043_004876 [Ampulex compressa]